MLYFFKLRLAVTPDEVADFHRAPGPSDFDGRVEVQPHGVVIHTPKCPLAFVWNTGEIGSMRGNTPLRGLLARDRKTIGITDADFDYVPFHRLSRRFVNAARKAVHAKALNNAARIATAWGYIDHGPAFARWWPLASLTDLKAAVDAGHKVIWKDTGYEVIKDRCGQYLIVWDRGGEKESTIGLTWSDGTTLNGELEDFFDLVGTQA